MDSHVLNDLCFLCLSHFENLQSIFCKDNGGLIMEKKLICFLFDHVVNFVPTIEKFICMNCLTLVNNIYQYRNACIENIRILNDYLKKGTIEYEAGRHLSTTLDIIRDKKKQKINNYNIDIDRCHKIDTLLNNKEIENSITVKEEQSSSEIGDFEIEDLDIEEIELEDKNTTNNHSVITEFVKNSMFSPSSSKDQNIIDLSEQGNNSSASIEQIYVKQELESSDDHIENDTGQKGKSNIPLCALPEYSRKRYEVMYNRFMDWRRKNNIETYSEEIVLRYFVEEGKDLKSSSLWAHYSMLRTTLAVNQNVDLTRYHKLRQFLKTKAKGYIAKKSKSFSINEILKFINEAPDVKYLLVKVVLVIGITGACRTTEICFLKLDNMEDLGSSLIIKVPDSKTKATRQFTISGHFYNLCKKYLSLRPEGMKEDRFFVNYQKGKCTKQFVGKNKIGCMPREIACFLNLPDPELFTAHCFRRSSIALGIDARNALHTLMVIGRLPSEMEGQFNSFK